MLFLSFRLSCNYIRRISRRLGQIPPGVKSLLKDPRCRWSSGRHCAKFPIELRSLRTRPAGNRVTQSGMARVAESKTSSSFATFTPDVTVVVLSRSSAAEFRLLTRSVCSDCYVSPLTSSVRQCAGTVRGVLVNQLKPLWPNARRREPVARWRLRDASSNVLKRRDVDENHCEFAQRVAEVICAISIAKFSKYRIYKRRNPEHILCGKTE